MRILLLCSAFNGLTQRIHRELIQAGHDVSVELAISPETMLEAVRLFSPELILCPFLKHRVPNEIWERHKVLVVHPGIEGDRGPSSLDWAIISSTPEWGVTVVEAAEEMDAGNIWGTKTFPLRAASKASAYRREVSAVASELVKEALENFKNKRFKSRPLNYSDPMVTGRLMRPIQQHDRAIDWSSHSTEEIVRTLNAADSFPGVLVQLEGQQLYLYGAHAADDMQSLGLSGFDHLLPGQLLAHSHGAVCIKTCDGAVWVSHLKSANKSDPGKAPGKTPIKLPAATVLGERCQSLPHIETDGPFGHNVGFREIDYAEDGPVGYVYFNFYNGAMSTTQCERLRKVLIHAKKQPTKAIVLMGGDEFWSNGIHLNCIEGAASPADESWNNINAMNDVVREVLDSPSQLMVAALRTNAGAGGAVLAAACDYVIARNGIVLNVHYKTMGLFGSEYWTYVLPKRVGKQMADQLIEGCLPTIATEALEMGLVDCVLSEDWQSYHQQLMQQCDSLVNEQWQSLMNKKIKQRIKDERQRPLENNREVELDRMHTTFYDPNSDYHEARRRFVYKKAATHTPLYLAVHRQVGRKSSAA